MKRILNTLLLLLATSAMVYAQEDLLDILDSEQEEVETTVSSIFKAQRLINGHTVVTRKAKELEFLISHRFGRINGGIDQFFGLDQANIRFSLEYGITDKITAGVGRNSFEKVYDGFVKYNLLEQKTTGTPVAVTGFSSMAIRTADNFAFDDDDFNSKVSYTHQLFIARKMNENLSLQLSPTFVHRNKVLDTQKNDLLALGIGSRYKLSTRMAINFEYYYRLTEEITTDFKDAIGVGVEIETGGHVFHLQLSNSRSMVERGFITETRGDFFGGDIHFGFNISRVF